MNKEVTIYTTIWCPVCGMVKNFLTDMNIPFKEVPIDVHPIERLKLIRKTKKLTVPQTNVGGEWVSGFDPVRMLEIINDPKAN